MTHTTTQNHLLPVRGVMSVEEFLQWAGISRWLFYKLVKQGAIRPRKVQSRTIIPIEEAERWLRNLPELNRTDSGRPQE
ncbi:MAG: Helix-turn-helix domain [Holophagaceae bacterium]|nr:Helix-turn-helix domain [Holophagaceae bacterium]